MAKIMEDDLKYHGYWKGISITISTLLFLWQECINFLLRKCSCIFFSIRLRNFFFGALFPVRDDKNWQGLLYCNRIAFKKISSCFYSFYFYYLFYFSFFKDIFKSEQNSLNGIVCSLCSRHLFLIFKVKMPFQVS